MKTIESNGSDLSCKDAARQRLQGSLTNKRVSLTAGETAFLRALLLDPATLDDADHAIQMNAATKRLNDDMLFHTPFTQEPATQPPKCRRGQSNFIGLWKAYEEGVRPQSLVKKNQEKVNKREAKRQSQLEQELNNKCLGTTDSDSIKSDDEVRTDASQYHEDLGYDSWDEQEEAPEHYDAWKVLKDEYAKDFGFDYNQKLLTAEELDSDNFGNNFRILGTSADDCSARPHVLSPPLMDVLMKHFPSFLASNNYWLKFSLVRDGASLDTLKRYVRAATHTVLAIETITGEVFGSFTSSPWRTQSGYYGTGEAFLWRMCKSRKTKVYSLFEQAQLETEIDIYPYSGLNEFVQLCTHDRIALGGGGAGGGVGNDLSMAGNNQQETVQGLALSTGFGMAINDDLLNGTSSPCATFQNPCLVNPASSSETFQVVNIECWGLTPCFSVDEAEKLEMTKFFVQESSARSLSKASLSGETAQREFSSKELKQPEFFRRVGTNDQSEAGRDRWQYAAMMGTQGFR